jgi:hypothetical protein
MRQGNLNQSSTTDSRSSSQPPTNSPPLAVLGLSRCGSRFCEYPELTSKSKCLLMSTLASSGEKHRLRSADKSLFWNTLRISPCSPRFYWERCYPSRSKCLRMMILEKRAKKNVNRQTFTECEEQKSQAHVLDATLWRSRKIICSAVLSSGVLANEPYSATGSRPTSRNRARR